MFIKLQHYLVSIIKYWLTHKTKRCVSRHGFGEIIARKLVSVKVLENLLGFACMDKKRRPLDVVIGCLARYASVWKIPSPPSFSTIPLSSSSDIGVK